MAYSNIDFRNQNETFVIEPFESKRVTPVGYDLTVGFAVIAKKELISNECLDYRKYRPNDDEPDFKNNIKEVSELVIPPKTGFIVIPAEKIFLSGKVLGTIHNKSRISARGILANPVTIDPNFGRGAGRLAFYFYNSSNDNFIVSERMQIATLVLHSVETETHTTPTTSSFTATLAIYKEIYDDILLNKIFDYVSYFRTSKGDIKFHSSMNKLDFHMRHNYLQRKIIKFVGWIKNNKKIIYFSIFIALLVLIYTEVSNKDSNFYFIKKYFEAIAALSLVLATHYILNKSEKNIEHR